jgi:hypothetical protein
MKCAHVCVHGPFLGSRSIYILLGLFMMCTSMGVENQLQCACGLGLGVYCLCLLQLQGLF